MTNRFHISFPRYLEVTVISLLISVSSWTVGGFSPCHLQVKSRATPLCVPSTGQFSYKWSKSSTKPLSMAVEGDFDPESLSKDVSEAQAGSIKAKFRALYKFARPHTIRGTVLASIAGTIRALRDTPGAFANAQWGALLPRAFVGALALLFGNVFIVGINQIFDEGIDKLNKPFLPVASGEMSARFAWIAVLSSGIIGPLIVCVHNVSRTIWLSNCQTLFHLSQTITFSVVAFAFSGESISLSFYFVSTWLDGGLVQLIRSLPFERNRILSWLALLSQL